MRLGLVSPSRMQKVTTGIATHEVVLPGCAPSIGPGWQRCHELSAAFRCFTKQPVFRSCSENNFAYSSFNY